MIHEVFINPRRMREGYGTCFVVNPRRMREGYGTCFVGRSVCLSVSSATEISDRFYASTKV